jgi:hypothetical protein
MLIKYGDGKITSVIENDEELDEKQKNAFKNVSKALSAPKEDKNAKKLGS